MRPTDVKLQAERYDGSNAIARHGTAGVVVAGVEYRENVLVPWQGEVRRWEAGAFADLTEAHFDAIAELQPELVVFGSGSRMRFPPPRLLRGLMAKRIGVESMDTPAACRTYNVLLGEGRSVVAALLFE